MTLPCDHPVRDLAIRLEAALFYLRLSEATLAAGRLRVLTSPEEADRIEASTAMEILREIDQLWGEGRD